MSNISKCFNTLYYKNYFNLAENLAGFAKNLKTPVFMPVPANYQQSYPQDDGVKKSASFQRMVVHT